MKFLRILVVTLSAALLFSCSKKDPDAPAREEEKVVEIKTIELRKSSLEIDIKMEEGKIIEVVTPSYMEVPLKRLGARIEDESIVSVSFEESAHGFRVLPKAVGKTDVVIYADKGPAYAVCSVEVSEGGLADNVEVTKIAAEETRIILSDLVMSSGAKPRGESKTLDITLEPAEASLSKDVTIWTDREDVIYSYPVYGKNQIKVETEPNDSDDPSVTGLFHIYLKPKKGSAKTLDITVDVRGHVYGFTFDGVENSDPLYLTVGNKAFDLKPRLLKTGEVKEEDEKYEISITEKSGSSYVESSDNVAEISEDGKVSAVAGFPTKVHYLTAYVDALNTTFTRPAFCNIPFYTYDKVEELKVEVVGGLEDFYNVGEQIKFNVNVLPATADQRYEVSLYGTNKFEKVSDKDGVVVVKVLEGSLTEEFISFIATADNNKSRSFKMLLNNLKASDVKVGDYVYYSSNMGRFFSVDGGLRFGENTLTKNDFRDDTSVEPEERAEGTLIGIIFDLLSADEVSRIEKYGRRDGGGTLKLAGLVNAGGKHVGIISVRNSGEYRWCDEKDSAESINETWANELSFGAAPSVQSGSVFRTYPYDNYRFNLGWAAYNEKRGASHRMKAVYPVEDFSETSSDYSKITFPVRLDLCTQWLLPASGYQYTDELIKKRVNKLASKGLGDKLEGPYWLCTFDSSNKANAWACKPSKWSSGSNSGKVVGSVGKNGKCDTRPVLYL
ncbi:MAG: hypothetical protein IJ799_05850 [Bacteroidales bacterium]|nr:hypothetical protein [Bacteroidales bacterium]